MTTPFCVLCVSTCSASLFTLTVLVTVPSSIGMSMRTAELASIFTPSLLIVPEALVGGGNVVVIDAECGESIEALGVGHRVALHVCRNAVATTVTPGTTAPLGSVTTPEIEPVMAAEAVRVPRSTAVATAAKDTNLTNRFMALDLSKLKLVAGPETKR